MKYPTRKPREKTLKGKKDFFKHSRLCFYVDSRVHIQAYEEAHNGENGGYNIFMRLTQREAKQLHNWLGRAIDWGKLFRS